MKYLTRANMLVVCQETGLTMEELDQYMIYHEEAGNHHAPLPRKRRSEMQSSRLPEHHQESSLGQDQSLSVVL